ncbi:phosphoserine phosphatase SerB [Algisphaera agarilytica]|uniref:Phosphoserine phosphatase n=1 Tax=Algisphaera agarilytica TaxID=1385975 RepID=A0A7X0H8V4_9BACT|nr:phosphoserine phosphatase SerB [Algisphaera agarilytica]MBB6429939.1 phosphoserine phosphatase [Algisphaera agarilytica]
MAEKPTITTTHLLRFTGEDRPGLTAELSDALAQLGATVLDINQAVIHQSLLLGMMVRLPDDLVCDEAKTKKTLKAIRKVAKHHDLKLKAKPIADANYDHWVGRQGKPRHILTLLTRSLTAEQLAAVTSVIAAQGLNIDVIHRLSGRPPRPGSEADTGQPRRACIEFWLRGELRDADAMHGHFMQLGSDLSLDIAWQKDDVYRRSRRMVVFDMDSTLIQAEVIDELAKEAGAGDQVAAITEAAMRGELDFDASLRQRAATLAGLPESTMQTVAERLVLTEGCETLLANLKAFGYKTAVLSGGFTYFGRHLQQKLGLDHVHANELEIVDGKLTGNVLGTIVNGPRKAELLGELAATEGINEQQVVAVGDGANDLPMLNRAGLGIAFHAKPIVREQAEQSVSTLGLDAVLYLLGVRDRQRTAQTD